MSSIYVLKLTPRPSPDWKGFVIASHKAYRSIEAVNAILNQRGLDQVWPQQSSGVTDWWWGYGPLEGPIAHVDVHCMELEES